MSLPFRLFPGGAPPVDSDKLLISRADAGSPTGFSNYIVTWGELKSTLSNAVPGMDGIDGEDGMTIIGPRGATGAAGTNGRDGVSIPGLDGADAEEPLVIPGAAGRDGTNGVIGRDGAIGAPGMDGADAEEPLVIPGPRGATGANGANGASGTNLLLVESEIEEPVVIPGARGADGAAGPAGGNVVTTSMFVVDAEMEEPLLVPGPKGDTGATGGGGGGSASFSQVETNVGSTPRFRGKFTLVNASITAASKIFITQAPGPYTGKGTRADEAEMDPITAIAIAGTGTATVIWQTTGYIVANTYVPGGKVSTLAPPQDDHSLRPIPARLGRVKGNIKFNYLLG
jgi:hypothetical protein